MSRSTHRTLSPSFRAKLGIRLFFWLMLPLVVAFPSSAQVTTGAPPFGSFGGGPDIINLANLNAHWAIPVLHKSGRAGMNFTYDLSYDSSVWYPVFSNGTTSWQPVGNWGWGGVTQAITGSLSHTEIDYTCQMCNQYTCWYPVGQITLSNWKYQDPWGVPHSFSGTAIINNGVCPQQYGGPNSSGFTSTTSDGSGITLTITGSSNTTGLTIALIKSDGTNLNTSNGSGGGNTDRNGNEITVDGSGHFYDTLSSTAPVLTVAGSGTATSPMTFAYTAPSTGSAAYTMKYTTYSIQTNFGCSNITDYGTNGTATASLVSEIDLPDWNATTNPNSRYTFNYESTPGHSGFVTGRLASVTLPTGGTISYHYTGGSSGNITCADGSTPGLQRVLSDGASWSATWTYARTPGTGAASTTTVTDAERDTLAPNGNDTVTQFQGIYETQLQIYQGLHTSGALLQTINTCYNANTSNCATTAITLPITQRNITTVLPNSQQSEHDDFWNTYGAPTETDDYDYGTAPHGSLLKKVLASYATLGNINAFRQTVTTQDGSGNPVSKVTYNYDETTPTTTSGTPQHFSVPAPWGNLTSTYTYTNSGGFLSDSRTYYDTGMFKTTTDVNGGITTYNYASGAASCYNAFPTSINEPISGLSTSATWNCTGGVQLTSVDENSQTTTTAYTDPYFWRPASVTDQTGAATYFCYAALSAGACPSTPNTTQVESYMNFNSGNSTVDSLTTLDGLGRLRVQQKRRGPASSSSNFDSVETDYDSLGRVSHVTLPYVGTAGQTNSSAAGTTTTYDAMNRPRTVSDSGGGTTSYNYGTANDTLVTRSPAPTGENTKVRQFESDALGRLTSVCEVTAGTTAWPGGTCAQNSSPQPTGYWTRYTYDPMGNLMTVTQNAQSTSNQQARTYVYDWMGRMTSETNPESGTKTYVYDSDSTMCGNGAYSSRGDLLKTTDAAGNCVMRYYDSLHRLTDVGNNNQSATNPCKRFRYDNSSGYVGSTKPAGLNNTLGRLIEAATDVCAGSNDAILTDEWFSYSQRGETSDVYESTPHSGAYYHSASTYWANRAPNQLTGNIGLPTTITRSPDGEGRTNSVSASSGQSPLISSTVYSPASFPTTINLGSGSGDADAYTYDPNTNRMTQYQFTVNGTSLTGALGWNANGTVQTQNITDGFNSADIQNCSYQYDDITRVVSANCGVAAAQTFTFDPFGNISKSGSPYGFNPVYSTSTNRMTALGSFTPTYDNNGNLTNDNIHNYAWDADGRAITVDAGLSDAVSLTYDALGRMVEQNRGGTYTQIAYSPTGDKLATMSGSTLQKAMVPLIGQSQAIYNSSGLLYYAHPDLLGSIRLATTPGRAMYFDTAYAPFGETYAYSGNLDPAYTGQMNDTAHREDVAGGLYDFPLREYSIQGRWPNPDPLGNAATSPGDPQTQNRYAYVRNNPVTYVDPTGGQFCSPEDPECCDPFTDPLCFPFPPPGGGLGGGGGNPEKPRSFPWPLLPPGFFSALEGGGGIVLVAGEANCECTSRSSRPKAPSFFSFACFYSCICDNPKNYDHTPTLFVTFKHLLVQHVKQYGRTCTYCPKTARGKWAYAVEQDTLFPGVNLDTTFYSLLYLTYVSETQ